MAETNNVDIASIMNMVATLSPEGSGARKDVIIEPAAPAPAPVSEPAPSAAPVRAATVRTLGSAGSLTADDVADAPATGRRAETSPEELAARHKRIVAALASELNQPAARIESVISLIDEGATIPFIARYRKEATGGMDDVALRTLDDRLSYLRNLEQRKSDVIAVIDAQGKLTEELRASIEEASTLQRVEDLYKPYRKKRATRASKARDAGLEPLANLILMQPAQGAEPLVAAAEYVNAEGGFATAEAALAGARDIVAELVAEDPENTADLREYTHKTAAIESEAIDADEKTPYEPYYEFSEAARSIPNHRILAINRGEREGKLRVRVRVDGEAAAERLQSRYPRRRGPFASELNAAIADGYKRLMAPSLERELRVDLTMRAQADAIKVFAKNTEGLLQQRPVRGARVIALDPGIVPAARSRCSTSTANCSTTRFCIPRRRVATSRAPSASFCASPANTASTPSWWATARRAARPRRSCPPSSPSPPPSCVTPSSMRRVPLCTRLPSWRARSTRTST